MPRLKESTKKLRAAKLAKALIKNDLNKSAVARELGVTPQAIGQQVNTPAVQDKLQEFLNSPELKNTLIQVGIDGLQASKPINASILVDKDGKVVKAEDSGAIEVPDYSGRHKYWHDLMIACGGIKLDKHEAGISIINIIYGYRSKRDISPLRIRQEREPEPAESNPAESS